MFTETLHANGNGKAATVGTYRRCSTPGQVELYGWDAQQEILREHCRRMGWTLVQEYEDPGISGSTLFSRPGIMRLLEDAQKGLFDTILVVEQTRLSRGELSDWQVIKTICDDNGITIVTPNGPYYRPCNDDDDFRSDIDGAMGKREKREIVKRLVRGKNGAISKGALLLALAPHGYRFEQYGRKRSEKRLVPVEEPAETVRILFELVAHGPGDGEWWGRLRICDHLNNTLKLPSPRGRHWNPVTVGWIIRNPVYKGVLLYGRTVRDTGNKRRQHLQPADLVDPEIVPPLVTVELWEAANEALSHRSEHGRGRPARKNPPGLLVSYLRCPHCGYKFAHNQVHRKQFLYRDYLCAGRYQYKALGIEPCRNPRWRAEDVARDVWETLKRHIESPELLRETAEERRREQPQIDSSELVALQRALAESDGAVERIMTMYRRGTYSVEVAEQQLEAARRERQEVEERLARLQGALDERAEWEAHFAESLKLVAEYQSAIRDADPPQQRRIIEDLVREVELDREGNVLIHHYLGQPCRRQVRSGRRGQAGSEMEKPSSKIPRSTTGSAATSGPS
jgi:DNA invertase Pin-like site-specific DNA recombinase